MATIIWTGSTVNDTIRFATYGQPSSTNTYTLDALAGTDTLDMVAGNQYASKFISTNFTIGTADSNGMIVVTGASSGGKDHFTFNLKSVESIKFSDTTVQLSYGTPVPPADTTPPTVSAYSPAVGATGVGVASDIVLTFSEAVQKGIGTIELHSGSATGSLVASYDVATSTNLSVYGSNLTINPTADWANGMHYYVTLAVGSIKDLAGNSYAGTTAYDFSTTSATPATDTTPPTVVTFNPANAATGVGISSDLVLTFSEPVQQGTGVIAIHNGSTTGAVVASSDNPMTESISISGSTLTIHHTNNLAYNTHYFLTFGQASVNDLAGNHFDANTPYDFITEQAPIAPSIPIVNPGTTSGNSDITPIIVGGGILGALSWVLFL